VSKFDKAFELIQKFEGLELVSYKCPAGVWTIGWGTTVYPDGKKVKAGDTCTREQADEYLMHDVKAFADKVVDLIDVPVTENELCALLSFSYNVGHGALKTSTLLRKLNAGVDRKLVADEFMRWTKAGGKTLNGLVRRRTAERNLFLT
jgi:lysozyme